MVSTLLKMSSKLSVPANLQASNLSPHHALKACQDLASCPSRMWSPRSLLQTKLCVSKEDSRAALDKPCLREPPHSTLCNSWKAIARHFSMSHQWNYDDLSMLESNFKAFLQVVQAMAKVTMISKRWSQWTLMSPQGHHNFSKRLQKVTQMTSTICKMQSQGIFQHLCKQSWSILLSTSQLQWSSWTCKSKCNLQHLHKLTRFSELSHRSCKRLLQWNSCEAHEQKSGNSTTCQGKHHLLPWSGKSNRSATLWITECHQALQVTSVTTGKSWMQSQCCAHDGPWTPQAMMAFGLCK